MVHKFACLGAVALLPVWAADAPSIIRPDDHTLVLRLGQAITAIENVKVFVPPNREFPITATYKGHTITVTLPDDAVRAIRARTLVHGHSTLYIGSVTTATTAPPKPKHPPAKAPKVEPPEPQIDNEYLIPDVFTFAARQMFGSHLLLEVIYAPDKSLLSDPKLFTAKSGKVEYKVIGTKFYDTVVPPRLELQLDQTPRNGEAIKVTIKPPGGKPIPAASVSNTAAPKATASDHTGGADIYAAVNYTRNAITSPSSPANVYGIDATLQHPFWLAALSGSNDFLYFAPKFSIKDYSKEQDNENTMSVAAPLKLWAITRRLEPVIESIIMGAAPTYEADVLQHNKNIVADLTLTPLFVDQPVGNGKVARLRFYPFAGMELGHTLHNDLPQLDGAGVERFKTGASAELKFFVKRSMLDSITVSGSYTYRYLFHPEIYREAQTVQTPAGVLTTSTGQQIPLPAGTLTEQVFITSNAAPRRYLDLSLNAAMTSNFSAKLEYSRGELPPAFQRVDKLQAGIVFMFNFGAK
jgi:hypothetical protein